MEDSRWGSYIHINNIIMLISKDTIKSKNLISSYINYDIQTQQAGFDFTVEKIYSWTGKGSLDFDNTNRVLPKISEIKSTDGWYDLKKGNYMVEFKEKLDIPYNIAGYIISRTSLNRSGAAIIAGLIDPGYQGYITTILEVLNKNGINIKKGARIAQSIYFSTDSADLDNIYNGFYKKKSIKKIHNI